LDQVDDPAVIAFALTAATSSRVRREQAHRCGPAEVVVSRRQR
jgi:hypothetical protein